MYVCCCMAVTDAEVNAAISSGAHSRDAVTRACRAGGDCGACHGMIETMIEDHLDEHGCAGGCCAPADETSGPSLVAATALVRGRAA
jgi:bacterioferritin-associated ferredoxin